MFSGQITPAVLYKLRENYTFSVHVLQNMTNLFQPLDLAVNGAANNPWADTFFGSPLETKHNTDF